MSVVPQQIFRDDVLSDKRILITGGGTGLGKELARDKETSEHSQNSANKTKEGKQSVHVSVGGGYRESCSKTSSACSAEQIGIRQRIAKDCLIDGAAT